MAIVTVPKDAFELCLFYSLGKFFNENIEQNYLLEPFNTIYKAIPIRDKKDIIKLLKTNKGVVVIEMQGEMTEISPSVMNGFYNEFDATTVTYAEGNYLYGTVNLRLVTDSNETSKNEVGKADLLEFKGIMTKILNNNIRIPIFDFTHNPETITDLEFVAKKIERDYTEIPKPFNELQEGVFTLPFYVRVIEVATYDRVLDVKKILNRVF